MREKLTRLARALRQSETSSEEKLWLALRNRQIDGWKFKRQAPRGPYIVDFMCLDAHLVIEVDGIQHEEPGARARDAQRTSVLHSQGLHVLRFSNSDVIDNPDGVLDEIYRALGERPAPSPGAYLRARRAQRPLPPRGGATLRVDGRGDSDASGKDICE